MPTNYPLPLPTCYVLSVDEDSGDGWILLQDVSQTHRAGKGAHEHLSVLQVQRALKSLAVFHAYWWQHEMLGAKTYMAFMNELEFAQLALEETQQTFLEELADELTDEQRAALEFSPKGVIKRCREAVTGADIRTLEHGDFHAGNLMFPSEGDDVMLIDFQTLRTGSDMNDVTFLISNSLTTQERRSVEQELLTGYHTDLTERGVTSYPFADCWNQYRDVMQFRRLYPSGERARGLSEDIWRGSLDKAAAMFEDFG